MRKKKRAPKPIKKRVLLAGWFKNAISAGRKYTHSTCYICGSVTPGIVTTVYLVRLKSGDSVHRRFTVCPTCLYRYTYRYLVDMAKEKRRKELRCEKRR